MTTSTVAPEIVAFAAAVRQALADLPAEEVDDLTDGLEADLAESYAEDLCRELPDPEAYATELRVAAGVPVRDAQRRPGLRETRDGLVAAARKNPTAAATLELLDALRPVWWVARAWVATWLLAAFFGMERGYWFDGAWWLVLVGLAVVSTQWGRDRWAFAGLSNLVLVGNVVAAVALLAVLDAASSTGSGSYEEGFDAALSSTGDTAGSGLSMDGQPVENVYAYDSAGNKISGVQLFDVEGRPLTPNRDVDTTQVVQTPVTLETGASALNVYPLAITRMIYDDLGSLVPDPSPDPDKVAAYADGPFLKVPAVQAPEQVATPND